MAVVLPASFDLVPVTGRFAAFDGVPLQGDITFTPSIPNLRSIDSRTVILARPVLGRVVDGELRHRSGTGILQLFATDDPDTDAAGTWYYTVTEALGAGSRAPYQLRVPVALKATGLDLYDGAKASTPTTPSDPVGAFSGAFLTYL